MEQYAHHFVFAFYLLCNEKHLKSTLFSGAYYQKLQEPGVMEIVCRNKTLTELYGEMLDQTLSKLWSDLVNADAFSQQENGEMEEELAIVVNGLLDEQDNTDEVVSFKEIPADLQITPILIPYNELNSMIRSLNHKQHELFNIVQIWTE